MMIFHSTFTTSFEKFVEDCFSFRYFDVFLILLVVIEYSVQVQFELDRSSLATICRSFLGFFTFSAESFSDIWSILFKCEFSKLSLLSFLCKSRAFHDYKDFQVLFSYPSKKLTTSQFYSKLCARRYFTKHNHWSNGKSLLINQNSLKK